MPNRDQVKESYVRSDPAGRTRLDEAVDKTLRFFQATCQPGDSYSSQRLRWPDRLGARKCQVDSGEGGYWIGELEADATLESDYILFLYFLDRDAHRDKIRKLANYVRQAQLEDGGWNIFHGGPPELSASVKAYFALKIAGDSVDQPFMVKARDGILSMGGAENVNSFTKIYRSFLNQFDWKDLPAIPPEIILLPRFFYFNVYEISYWSRAILIPLSILYAKKPSQQQKPDVDIREIFSGGNGNGSHGNGDGLSGRNNRRKNRRNNRRMGGRNGVGDVLGSGNGSLDRNAGSNGNGNGVGGALNGKARVPDIPKDPNLLSWRNFFSLVDRILRLVEKTPIKPFRTLALKKAEKWVISRSEDSDGLGAIFPSMVNSVMAMRCLGHDESHPAIASNLEKLQELEIESGDSIRLQPCLSPVWDTALVINAMIEAGYPADAPEIVESTRWLLSKEVRKPGDWNLRVPDVEVSGWPFQFKNEFYPDIDDSAAVLLALERCDHTKIDELEETISRGLNWIVSLQCSGGGWAAFDVDIDHECINQVPYADHNAMLDPACADITGRVLEMLCRFEEFRDTRAVQQAIARGIEFLKNSQESDGSWYGRWGVNYIYGTWQSLKGLMCAGESVEAPYIRKAAQWLESVQNEDGGWGETCGSYKNLSLKGVGKSTPSQTSWAVMGLIAAGKIRSRSVERGIEFLLSRQNENGTWDEDEYTGTGFPGVFYLRYHLYRVTFPLFALAYYRNVKNGMPVAGGHPSQRKSQQVGGQPGRKIRPPKGRTPESAFRSLRNGLFKTQR